MDAAEPKSPAANLDMKRNTSSRLLLSKSFRNLTTSFVDEVNTIAPPIEEIDAKSLESLVVDSRAELKHYLKLLGMYRLL